MYVCTFAIIGWLYARTLVGDSEASDPDDDPVVIDNDRRTDDNRRPTTSDDFRELNHVDYLNLYSSVCTVESNGV
jgi:hypothetical protein